MERNLQNIDVIFKDAYQRLDEAPCPEVWSRLADELDKMDTENARQKTSSRKRIAAVCICFLAAGIFWLFVPHEQKYNSKQKNILQVSHSLINDAEKQTNDVLTVNVEKTPMDNNDNVADHNIAEAASPRQQFPGMEQVSNNSVAMLNVSPETDRWLHLPPGDKNDALMQVNDNKETPVLKKMNDKTLKNIFSYEKGTLTECFPILAAVPPIPAKLKENPGKAEPAFSSSGAGSRKAGKKKNDQEFKWTITAFNAVDFNFYNIDNDQQSTAGSSMQTTAIMHREKSDFSFSAGIYASRKLDDRWGIKTGLVFSKANIAIAPQEIYAAADDAGSVAYKYITSSGYGFVKPGFVALPAIGDSIRSAEAESRISSLSIPLMASYTFSKRKWSIIPSAGISANFITSASVETELTDANNVEAATLSNMKGMRNFYAGFVADVDLQYQVNARWALNATPSFRYALTPITKGNVVSTYPYGINIGIGITYKF